MSLIIACLFYSYKVRNTLRSSFFVSFLCIRVVVGVIQNYGRGLVSISIAYWTIRIWVGSLRNYYISLLVGLNWGTRSLFTVKGSLYGSSSRQDAVGLGGSINAVLGHLVEILLTSCVALVLDLIVWLEEHLSVDF